MTESEQTLSMLTCMIYAAIMARGAEQYTVVTHDGQFSISREDLESVAILANYLTVEHAKLWREIQAGPPVVGTN